MAETTIVDNTQSRGQSLLVHVGEDHFPVTTIDDRQLTMSLSSIVHRLSSAQPAIDSGLAVLDWPGEASLHPRYFGSYVNSEYVKKWYCAMAIRSKHETG